MLPRRYLYGAPLLPICRYYAIDAAARCLRARAYIRRKRLPALCHTRVTWRRRRFREYHYARMSGGALMHTMRRCRHAARAGYVTRVMLFI